MKLMIRTQPAIIGWDTKNAQQTTPAFPKDKLDLEVTDPKVEITSTQAKVNIDQDQCFNEAGIKNNKAFMDDNVSYSKQAVAEGIANKVENGNQMMAIENGEDAIAAQASHNAWDRFQKSFGLVSMPQSRPIITVQEGDVEIDYQAGDVDVLNGPFIADKGTYEAGKVEFYMKQKNSITITPVGDEVDITV